ncbi:MAG: ATP-binding protein [Candidatus Methanoperedens sp.]|uniref:ATP-binding protein n=1 Tax=Candidatus Methanoperedens sp. BLZ2 TaxID=2035255 RepID=UPI000BE43F18|nr:ATP-binding protein [Candidatus Methanoperedens sp. BLZ2]KAB2944708.1 MAG: ATP-binding protein [Candidatus Methanoperedens sp.]MBZ0175866.1 ATP-binding protein [Candidatus Methanoperedens nitroreducens]MCX9076377.1 ATP-binding protein [Candidatus Methanoperedens sp.]
MDENTKIALDRQNPWWFVKQFDTGIDRLPWYPWITKYLKAREVLLLLGARRTGKSTLVYQIIKSLLKDKTSPEAILFINLDEPLFQSKSKDPVFLTEMIEYYFAEKKSISTYYLFIDEVQNYDYWVQSIKTLYDTRKNLKIILTGSTSTLLHKEISTRLSGRYFHIMVYPLSFREYLSFKQLQKPTTIEKLQYFNDYLEFGAFPRVVLENDKDLKQELLKNYFQTIYLKDIIYPNNLRNNKDVFDLLYFIISNIGKNFSYSNLAKTLGIAVETVKEYIGFAENSYLIYTLMKYDISVKKQIANPKKIYCLDTGLVNSISFRFSENKGRLIENLVYMSLIKEKNEIYYHKENHECDFIIKDGMKIKSAVQATLTLKDETTRKREIRGLLEAMNAYNLKEGLIITEKEAQLIDIDDKKIVVKPIYEWLDEIESGKG